MIETRALTRLFGRQAAVQDLDLDVHPGEIYGFLGPNGAGKTTTIRMLAGLLRPTSGDLRIAGVDPRVDPRAARSAVGLVPDAAPLYDYLTGREYVAFVASLYGGHDPELAARLLARLELASRADELCKGYSHGMRKKLHVAAILAVRPRVLLLDEPTNGLDPRSARALKDVLLEVRTEGTCVFLSTHLLSTAEEICDRVGVLSKGRLLAEGTVPALKAGREATLEQLFLELTGEGEDVAQRP